MFAPLRPLTKFGRISRSIILVALILGTLFPMVAGVAVATIAAPLALGIVLYEILRWLPKLHPIVFVPVGFGLVWIHATLVPPMTSYGEDKLSTWLTATLVTACSAALLRDELAVLTFCRTWLIASGFLAAVTIAGFSGGRADGFDSNPIWLARAMATGMVIAVYLASRGHIRPWLFLLLAALLAAGVLATGSRGPILAMGVGSICLILFDQRHRVRRIIGIALGASVAYWAVERLPFFANSRFSNFLADGDSDAFRRTFWEATPPVIQDHPGGVGIGNWIIFADAPKHFQWPHNLFLEVFAELGVAFGLGLIVIIAGVSIGLLIRARRTPVAILALGLLVTETAQVSTSGDLNGRTFWFLLVLAVLIAVGATLKPEASSQDLIQPRFTPQPTKSTKSAAH